VMFRIVVCFKDQVISPWAGGKMRVLAVKSESRPVLTLRGEYFAVNVSRSTVGDKVDGQLYLSRDAVAYLYVEKEA